MNGTELRATLSLAAIFATRLLGLFMIYPIFAQYARGLSGADDRTIGLALGAYGLTQGLLQIPFGILSDHIGRKKVIVGGLVLFALGSVVAAIVQFDPRRSDRPNHTGGGRHRIVDPGHGGRPHPRGGANPRHGRGRNHHRLFLRARRSRRSAARRRRWPVGHVLGDRRIRPRRRRHYAAGRRRRPITPFRAASAGRPSSGCCRTASCCGSISRFSSSTPF